MSELKAYNVVATADVNPDVVDILGCTEWFGYDKDEADKVIAELKAQKAQAEDDCAYWKMSEGNAVNATHETEEYAMQLYKELRRQKYKRCLAMVKMCKAKYDKEDAKVNGRGASWDYTSPEMKYWERWRWRWDAIADKFKEATNGL